MSDVVTVSVLIPARNEEADIARCLRAVLSQDHPHDHMQIVLVDGGSTDRTAEIAASVLSEGDIDWRIVHNAVGTTPSNLNAGLAVAAGEILCRVDARSIVPCDYVRSCAQVLRDRPDVAVIGGAQVATPAAESTVAAGIARALNNRFAMGGARYRSGTTSGVADTVYLGAFRTEEVRQVHGWDDYLLTNQDFDLNRRMSKRGLIWFDARLQVEYTPRASLGMLWRQYHRFGRWKVRYWRHAGDRPQPRQLGLIAGGVIVLLGAVRLSTTRRGRLAGGIGGVASLAIVDHLGSGGSSVKPQVRLVGLAGILVTSVGWLSGVLLETTCGRRS